MVYLTVPEAVAGVAQRFGRAHEREAGPGGRYFAGLGADVAAGRAERSSWSRRETVEALIEAYDGRGAWPAGGSWERATAKHPARRTYVRVFGVLAGAGAVDLYPTAAPGMLDCSPTFWL